MPQQETKNHDLQPQAAEVIRDYEFRINNEYVTRPTVEVRRRGGYSWIAVALIIPDSNFNTIMVDAAVKCVHHLTPMIEEEVRDNGN